MDCPDSNQLIDLIGRSSPDPDLMEHLGVCPSCRAEFRILSEIPLALQPEGEVPEVLVQRVIQSLPEPQARWECKRAPAFQVAGAAIMGAVTMVLAILFTGSIQRGGLTDLLFFSLAIGIASGVFQYCSGDEGELDSSYGTKEA